VSELERPGAGLPGWVVATLAIGGVLAAFWVVGVVMAAIGLLVRLALAVVVVVLIAAFVVSKLEGDRH